MNSEQNGATAHTPEISEQMLENKIEELIADLEGRDSRQKQRLIYSIEQIMTIQRSYRTLCRDFAEIAAHSQNFMSIDIVVSPGAIKNCYLNLRDAILSGMVEKEEEIQIEFPGTGLLPVAATVKLSGTIQGRKVFKPFFTAMRVTAGDVIRFAMNGAEKTFTITVIDPDQKVRSGPLLPPTNRRQPFTFSEKGIQVGEKIAYIADPSIEAEVCDDRHVMYNGERISLTKLLMILRGKRYFGQPTRFFSYNGTKILDIEDQ